MTIVNINEIGEIYISRWTDARVSNKRMSWDLGTYEKIKFNKYTIKETDFRVKTATFTSPQYIDLTTGQFIILIKSKYHENFGGVILDSNYDEDKKLYSYQCQDWSRDYMASQETVLLGDVTLYEAIRAVLAHNEVGFKITSEQKELLKSVLAGLKPVGLYDQSIYEGNIYKTNPMQNKPKIVARNTTEIEYIRDLVFSQTGFFDVWFNDNGVLQIQPLSKTDWENTGLHLTDSEIANRNFKFNTTNVITQVIIEGEGTKLGKIQGSLDTLGLNLSAFFGHLGTTISNPAKSSASKNSSNSVKTNNTATTATTNPFNNKPKKILVSADGGSGDYKDTIIGYLQRDGWSVTDLGTGPGTHSASYNMLSGYAVNLTIYNGADPKTIDEPVTGWLKGRHEQYGVRLVQMFDSRHWTSKTGTYNKKGLWYKRYGDFEGYRVPKAWDDNYSGASSGVLIENLGAWYKKYHNQVAYCCGPTPADAYKQFCAGGYLKMKGLV